jgi:hypothetical protein
MAPREPEGAQEQKQHQDTQRYVRRLLGYVVGRRREIVMRPKSWTAV